MARCAPPRSARALVQLHRQGGRGGERAAVCVEFCHTLCRWWCPRCVHGVSTVCPLGCALKGGGRRGRCSGSSSSGRIRSKAKGGIIAYGCCETLIPPATSPTTTPNNPHIGQNHRWNSLQMTFGGSKRLLLRQAASFAELAWTQGAQATLGAGVCRRTWDPLSESLAHFTTTFPEFLPRICIEFTQL